MTSAQCFSHTPVERRLLPAVRSFDAEHVREFRQDAIPFVLAGLRVEHALEEHFFDAVLVCPQLGLNFTQIEVPVYRQKSKKHLLAR